MPKLKIDTVKRSVTTTRGLENMMEDLLATGRFLSYDDIIRKGIAMVYDSINPPYRKPTVNQEIKIEKRVKEIQIRNIPDEEFVAQNLEDVMIYTDNDGQKFVLIRWLGNSIGAVPLSGIKDWFADKDDPIVKTHVQMANSGQLPYLEKLTSNSTRQWLNERFGVAINFDPKYNGGIYDEEFGGVRP